jgi:hypothetical protein
VPSSSSNLFWPESSQSAKKRYVEGSSRGIENSGQKPLEWKPRPHYPRPNLPLQYIAKILCEKERIPIRQLRVGHQRNQKLAGLREQLVCQPPESYSMDWRKWRGFTMIRLARSAFVALILEEARNGFTVRMCLNLTAFGKFKKAKKRLISLFNKQPLSSVKQSLKG